MRKYFPCRNFSGEAIGEIRERTGSEDAVKIPAAELSVQCGDRIAAVHDGNGEEIAVIATASIRNH